MLYMHLFAPLSIEPPTPDLVVYLQAPVDVLLTRIRHRAIEHEQFVDRDCLERQNEAYAAFFSAGPLLVVDAASIDPISNDKDYVRSCSRRSQTYSHLPALCLCARDCA